MGENGYYYQAEKNKDNFNLEQSKKLMKINAGSVVPYGFAFEFGPSKEVRFTLGKYHSENIALTEKDVTKKNFEFTINSLEKMVEDKGADYILVDNFHRNHEDFYGKAQLLLKLPCAD